MKEFELTITDENGLHARPAGIVVKVAKEIHQRCHHPGRGEGMRHEKSRSRSWDWAS